MTRRRDGRSVECWSPVWDGDPEEEARFAPFLRAANQVGSQVIWWLEPDLSGVCDLLITRELADGPPMRVQPGQRLQRFGHELVVARAGDGPS